MKKLSELYQKTELTANMEDYMETIAILAEKNRVVRVKDIAASLDIKMPSVTAALNKLKEKEYIEYEKYGFIELTPEGKVIAESIYQRHMVLKDYYQLVLLLDEEQASIEACKVEHHLTPETLRQVHKLVEFFKKEIKKDKAWLKDHKRELKK